VRLFRKRYATLTTFAPYREMPKYHMIVAIDGLRRHALDLADGWVAAGRLDRRAQIFDLTLADITRAEADPAFEVRAIAEANRAYYARFNPHANPPVLIDSRGFIPTLPPRPAAEGELRGTPVSPGFVRGPVKVLKRADEKPIAPGDILVTRATDPGWTTLFLNAAGVLLESGGTLQHGASVARESCTPCIVGVVGVTDALRDGMVVEMDGGEGWVRVVG
jgi:pyruvate,water dikinase